MTTVLGAGLVELFFISFLPFLLHLLLLLPLSSIERSSAGKEVDEKARVPECTR